MAGWSVNASRVLVPSPVLAPNQGRCVSQSRCYCSEEKGSLLLVVATCVFALMILVVHYSGRAVQRIR